MYKNELRNRKISYLYSLNNPCSFILNLRIESHTFPKTNTKVEKQTCSERNIEIPYMFQPPIPSLIISQ